MPFDSIILFLGIHPKDIIQKYVNAFYAKIFTIGTFIIGEKKNNKKTRNNVLSYKGGMIAETTICPLERK